MNNDGNENVQDHVSDQQENNSDVASEDSKETYTLVIKNGDNEYEVGSFGSSVEITTNEDQFNQLLKEIKDSKTEEKKIDSIIDGLNSISNTLEKQRKAEEQSRSGTVETPSDYYEYTSDVVGQINFFISLIFGLLVSFLFVYGLKR